MPLPSSEYFTEKAEENKEIQKQAAAEAEATLLPVTSDTPSTTALRGEKKAAKAGFSLFGFNVCLQ